MARRVAIVGYAKVIISMIYSNLNHLSAELFEVQSFF
jgi:hypothetical protein